MRPPLQPGTALSRALRLRCTRCGDGKLFRGFFRMHATCSVCGFRYERSPGYFLGSAYINYGVTAVLITVLYVALKFGADYSNRQIAPPLAVLCVAFPLFFFRYARALWLAMDCLIDRSVLDQDQD